MTLRSWSMSNSSVASLPANIMMDFFPPGCSPCNETTLTHLRGASYRAYKKCKSCQTGTASEGAGGCLFERSRAPKKCTGLVMGTFCRSAQNRPKGPFRFNMAATLAQLGPIGFSFGPRWRNLAPTWTHLGATSAQVQVHMGDIAGPIRNPQHARFHWSVHVFWLSMTLPLKQCSPCCVSIGPNLVWSSCQRRQVAAC